MYGVNGVFHGGFEACSGWIHISNYCPVAEKFHAVHQPLLRLRLRWKSVNATKIKQWREKRRWSNRHSELVARDPLQAMPLLRLQLRSKYRKVEKQEKETKNEITFLSQTSSEAMQPRPQQEKVEKIRQDFSVINQPSSGAIYPLLANHQSWQEYRFKEMQKELEKNEERARGKTSL